MQALATLSAQVQQLTATLIQFISLPAPLSHPPPSALAYPGPVLEARVGVPERYTGDPEGCNPFITNSSILFALQPYTFASEEAKVAFTVNNLTGRARLWATAGWERHTPACYSFSAFATKLCEVFGVTPRGPDTSGGLLGLGGSCSVTDYTIDFCIWALRNEWNQAAQVDAFLLGLADYVKDELVSYNLPASLDSIIELASVWTDGFKLDTERWLLILQLLPGHQLCPPSTSTPRRNSEPMQVGRASLTPQERERRCRGNLCLYCVQPRHFISR